MIITLCSWVVLTIIYAYLAHLAIWARGGNGKPRFLSIVGVFAGSALSFAALFIGSGTSPPCIAGLTAPKGKFGVVGFFPVPVSRIDIFYNDPVYGGSRVCYIPWSDKIVNAMIEAQQKQIELGVELSDGTSDGDSDNENGEPSVFPLHAENEMEKPPSAIQAP